MINPRARVRVRVKVTARARVTVRFSAGAKARASVRFSVTVSFRVRAVAESRAGVTVRLWLGPGLGQG